MLELSKQLFSEINCSNIRYCHFKSNEHLGPALNGKTDLDILVDNMHYKKFIMILLNNGFKQFEPVKYGTFPGVSNWFGFDKHRGKLIHLHIHTQLITGKTLVKDYVFPWAEIMLDSAVVSDFGVKVCNPNMELILLFSRMIVKRNIREKFKSYQYIYFADDVWNEINYLRQLSSERSIQDFFYKMYKKNITKEILELFLYSDKISKRLFSSFHNHIRKEQKGFRRMAEIEAVYYCYRNKLCRKKNIFLNLYCNGIFYDKKRLYAKPGIIVAFLGIDGAGKSTVIKEIAKWLKEEFDVIDLYLGAGDGKKSHVVQLMIRVYQKFYSEKYDNGKENELNENRGCTSLKKAIGASYAYSKLAKGNAKKINKAYRYRKNGGIVLCDRFPQSSVEVMHDGMRVQRYQREYNNLLIRHWAELERQAFRVFEEKEKIDLIIRLNIEPKVAYQRKCENEANSEEREHKAEILKWIDYANVSKKIIDVDSNCDLETTLLEVKKNIWECI